AQFNDIFHNTKRIMENNPATLYSLFDGSFVCVNVNQILDEFYTNKHVNPKLLATVFELSKAEKEIIGLLRKKSVSKMTIELNDKLKPYIQVGVTTKKVGKEVKSMVLDLAKQKGYKDIKITTNGNGAICIEETEKIRIMK
ncbi:MAG: hypothetical protein KDC11_11745, partial [Chitinophagaceae bacterium]|nr:hypothetical protein [Chitinophagaceae bacterium]